MMRRLSYTVLSLFLFCGVCQAQDEFLKRYQEFTSNVTDRHAAFTDSVNLIFSDALKQQWEHFHLDELKRRELPSLPDSLNSEAADDKEEGMCLPVSETKGPQPKPSPVTLETSGIGKGSNPSQYRKVNFSFYGTQQYASVPQEYGFLHPDGISESSVAEFWKVLASYDYHAITEDCKRCRESVGLNDWGILEWTTSLAEAVFPMNINDERTIFMVFILNQMGLMAKIARNSNELLCLFPSQQQIYSRKFIIIDSYSYYLTRTEVRVSDIYTYRTDFKKSNRQFDMRLSEPLSFGAASGFREVGMQSSVLNTTLTVPVNNSADLFYDRYPQMDPVIYATARPIVPFEERMVAQVEESVKNNGSTKDKLEMVLRFVQEDFRYRADVDEYGQEKPFFVEENFTHDVNDCEDRVVLLNFLVRGILGLRTVILDYPDHVALAVELSEDAKGDYVLHDGGRFYVCDPSYVGARVGMSMPKYRKVPAKVWAAY